MTRLSAALAVAAIALLADACATAPPPVVRPRTRGTPLRPPLLPQAPVGPIGDVTPRYPEMLRTAGVEGTVVLELTIDTTGRVVPRSERVLQRSQELFATEVRKVLPQWRFQPAHAVDSTSSSPRVVPVVATHRVTVSFHVTPAGPAPHRCPVGNPWTTVCAVLAPLLSRPSHR